jgi:hypothetical protein
MADDDEITIDRVEVAFEVEADDQAVFERYFAAAIRRWEAERSSREAQARRSAADRRIGTGRGRGGES